MFSLPMAILAPIILFVYFIGRKKQAIKKRRLSKNKSINNLEEAVFLGYEQEEQFSIITK